MGLKICVVTNYYPPFFIGGYELGCRDIVEALKARGHQVRVLTSTYRVDHPQIDGEVYRMLRLSQWWTPNRLGDLAGILKKEKTNQKAFRQLCREFEPDIVYVWNPVGISLSIVSVAQQLGLPLCYFVSDHWVEEWNTDPGYRMWEKQAAGLRRPFLWKGILLLLNSLNLAHRPAPPELRNVQFASECLKRDALEKGQMVSKAEVIHWGVDVERFRITEKSSQSKRLLFAGQLSPHKGVHTAIEALNLLVQKGHETATLTIVGDSILTDFKAKLRQMVQSFKLEKNVRFIGQVPREEITSIYQEHDVLIFPSVWEEPFSITVLEAMASGLAVVGTATGGSGEILEDGVNALIFEKENAEECAACISRLFTDEQLFERLRRLGRSTVEQKYRLEQMVDTIEHSLNHFNCRDGRPQRAAPTVVVNHATSSNRPDEQQL
ncbi:MAG TPA: glycosyltransferase family 4 protein [Pyrinomonadaceae bacterium]